MAKRHWELTRYCACGNCRYNEQFKTEGNLTIEIPCPKLKNLDRDEFPNNTVALWAQSN